jgi:hypothetical protein
MMFGLFNHDLYLIFSASEQQAEFEGKDGNDKHRTTALRRGSGSRPEPDAQVGS